VRLLLGEGGEVEAAAEPLVLSARLGPHLVRRENTSLLAQIAELEARFAGPAAG